MRDLVSELRQPGAYPYPVDHVEVVETHISWVFLAGPFAYKVKKPVNFGFLDYSTLERRRFFCAEEVRLNQGLAPNTYVGVVPVAQWADALRLEGAGEAVEYAVKMHRLPPERMLDALLAADKLTVPDIERLAARIAAFHGQARTGEGIDDFGGRRIIEQNSRENFEQVHPFVGRWLIHSQFARVYSFVHQELDRLAGLFERRVRGGRIRECHGDLRSESVWMDPSGEFQVFDCIEFNERLRCSDVASEVAFLASDLDWRGRPDLAWSWVEAYVRASRDEELRELLPFYKCYRAFVRGKVEAFEQEGVSSIEDRSKHGRAAREHFQLAESYALRFAPTLFLTCGHIGSGKTTLARGLASILGLPIISSDVVRKELAGINPREHQPSPAGGGLYQPGLVGQTYGEMYRRASELLRRGGGVILDATFARDSERQRAFQTARLAGAGYMVLNVEAPESLIYQRLVARSHGQVTESDAGPELFEQVKTRFEAPNGVSPTQLVRVPMTGSIGDAVRVALGGIRQRLPQDHDVRRSA
ncbi:MAG TPA: AAA family ATPase [Chloroflexota bacterium]|nr:AAA family ATPase [Chloroflexota bacterium]